MADTPFVLQLLAILERFVGAANAGPLKDVVYALYNSPPRFYHTIDHVESMFRYADMVGWKLDPAEELAIIFHDCVYVPGYNRNELRSAQTMLALLAPIMGDNQDAPGAAFCIIENTADFLRPSQALTGSRRVMDLDLMSLGDPSEEKWKIDRVNVEKELGCTPAQNAEFFKKLMERDAIFLTPGLGEWERRARSCMTAYIEEHGGD